MTKITTRIRTTVNGKSEITEVEKPIKDVLLDLIKRKKMNSYKLSNGHYIKKSTIDRNVRKAKEEKLRQHLDEHGYYFCTTCGKNTCKPIDCAHVISVDECQKTGRSELAWDLDNIIIEGRECHKYRDGLNLKFNDDSI